MADQALCHCGKPGRRWQNYTACDDHSPAGLRGATVPTPDPALTMDGLRRRWFADRGLPYVPETASPLSTSSRIDERNIARGKKRASGPAVKNAQHQQRNRR